MQTQYIVKHNYTAPEIDQIILDYEISLALESSPPDGPDEVLGAAPEYLNNDPFKLTIC
jgi:hypothetical protein